MLRRAIEAWDTMLKTGWRRCSAVPEGCTERRLAAFQFCCNRDERQGAGRGNDLI